MSVLNIISEDFPSLPVQKNNTKIDQQERSSSVESSVSSASVGAFRDQKTEQKEKIPNGTYLVVDDLIVRPHLKCRCEYCGSEWLTQAVWSKAKCQKAIVVPVDSVSTVKVLNSKVVHHKVGFKVSKFSVALVEGRDDEGDFRGWCLSKSLDYGLTHRQEIRSQSLARLNVFPREEVDRSRSNSVASFRQTTDVTSGFMLGEPVLAKVDDVNWVKAVVRDVKPLTAAVQNTGQLVSHISKIKKVTTRNFVVARDIPVRNTELNDKWAVKTGELKKGTVIAAFPSGYEGYVTSPVCGWITMRTEHSLNVVNESFVPAKQEPTIFVKNLPEDLTEAELRQNLFDKLMIYPKKIQFQSNGTAFRAAITFVCHAEALELAEQKTFEIRCEWNLGFEWDLQYLQKHALSSS